MSVVIRNHLFALAIMLALVGCRSSTDQARSDHTTPLLNTPTIRSTEATIPQAQIPTAGMSLRLPTAVLTKDINSLVPTLTPQNYDVPVVHKAPQEEACSPLEGIPLGELPAIVSSRYDPPPAGREDRHHGVDFAYYRRGNQSSIQGNGIQAIFPGVVAMSLADSFPYGNVVIVESDPVVLSTQWIRTLGIGEGQSLYTLYAHMEDNPLVRVGQEVMACHSLGVVGKSGNAGVAHLHLETRLGPSGVSFDQMGYYQAESTAQEKENYLRWRIGGEFRHFDPFSILTPEGQP